MKTRIIRNAVLNRVLDVAGFIAAVVVLTAFAAKSLGWKGDPIAALLRLPSYVLVPCFIVFSIVISGISAEIIVLTFRGCFPAVARWGDRTHFRLLVVLWILFAATQIAFLIWFRP